MDKGAKHKHKSQEAPSFLANNLLGINGADFRSVSSGIADLFPRFGATDNGANGDANDVKEKMAAAANDPMIGKRLEVLHKGNGNAWLVFSIYIDWRNQFRNDPLLRPDRFHESLLHSVGCVQIILLLSPSLTSTVLFAADAVAYLSQNAHLMRLP